MKNNEDDLTAQAYAEFYALSQKATREALKEYDLSGVSRENLVLETKKNKRSLVFKLFSTSGLSKSLIATTKINTTSHKASVTITGLNRKIE